MTEEIKSLTDYQHIRLRAGMYLGSTDPHTQDVLIFDDQYNSSIMEMTWVPAIYTTFREILDNALDEVVGHGHGNRIDVKYDTTSLKFSVADNGRGIPIDFDSQTGKHKVTMALTEPRTGRNFGERGNVAGTNGIGASAVSISSESFDIEVFRDGKKFTQRVTEGNAVVDELNIQKPKLVDSKSGQTGSRIEFTLSNVLFKHREMPDAFIMSKMVEIAAIHQNVSFYVNGKRIKTNKTLEKTLFPKDKIITIDINNGTFSSKFMLKPGAAIGDTHFSSIVNNIPAFNGGTHIDAFRRTFISGLLTALERESKRRKLTPNRADVGEGLLVYNVTQMDAPNFDSQSKTRLINEEAGKFVTKALGDEEIFKDILKRNKDWIEEIYQRCEDRTMKKDASDLDKESKKLSRRKIPKLIDATGRDRSKCVLLLTEGDSAIKNFTAARTSSIHAGLPLRGKVLNVNGENPKRVIESQALIDIMVTIGLQLNQKAERKSLRYGRIYIAHDEDQDGKNIGALLINFLFTYWPELFDDKDDPFVNIFMTPFIIASKGKDRHYWYSHNYAEFDPTQFRPNDIIRAKGLAALTVADWKHVFANPTLYPVVADENVQEALDLIFNNDRSNDRKVWLGL